MNLLSCQKKKKKKCHLSYLHVRTCIKIEIIFIWQHWPISIVALSNLFLDWTCKHTPEAYNIVVLQNIDYWWTKFSQTRNGELFHFSKHWDLLVTFDASGNRKWEKSACGKAPQSCCNSSRSVILSYIWPRRDLLADLVYNSSAHTNLGYHCCTMWWAGLCSFAAGVVYNFSIIQMYFLLL